MGRVTKRKSQNIIHKSFEHNEKYVAATIFKFRLRNDKNYKYFWQAVFIRTICEIFIHISYVFLKRIDLALFPWISTQ